MVMTSVCLRSLVRAERHKNHVNTFISLKIFGLMLLQGSQSHFYQGISRFFCEIIGS